MAGPARGLRDGYGRVIRYLRLSLTSACNFRCVFCRPDTAPASDRGQAALDTGEVLRLAGVLASLGVERIKITGGEPLLAPDVLTVIESLKPRAPGGISVTTNGTRLWRYAGDLARLGVDGVTVSLNALSAGGLCRLAGCRADPGRILDGIGRAQAGGLRVKINLVPIRGLNEDEILPLLAWALDRGISVRFIELMPLGHGRQFHGLSADEVLERIERRYGTTTATTGSLGNGPAVYRLLPGYDVPIGLIAAVSRPFCRHCDRLRLTRAGFLRVCLQHERGADLGGLVRTGATDGDLRQAIRAAVATRPAGHRFADGRAAATEVHMSRLGG
ncbi:MAG: GTP 3',8-cyclase MoaA [Planctomycetes bacterium]|nr:GTP 3',8-cyclase MoaA [Planctomycetota bacterium]